jgi:hypothetical protein
MPRTRSSPNCSGQTIGGTGTIVGLTGGHKADSFGSMGRSMGQWSVKTPVWVVLVSMLFVMLMVQAIPQVDLPDAAFHTDTAPVAIHARGLRAPAALTVHASSQGSFPVGTSVSRSDQDAVSGYSTPNSLPILHHSLRC